MKSKDLTGTSTSHPQPRQSPAIISAYNNVRLHSALSYVWPVDYYEGDPEALLAARHRKSQTARELWKQDNIKLQQRLMSWRETQTMFYPEATIVSL